MNRAELERMQDQAIRSVTAESLRLAEQLERARVHPALIDRPWFPWVTMAFGVALGTALALALPR